MPGVLLGALLPEAFISAAALMVESTEAVAGFFTVSVGLEADDADFEVEALGDEVADDADVVLLVDADEVVILDRGTALFTSTNFPSIKCSF